MSLTRQSRHYLLIGIVQWLLDWGVLVLLSHAGMSIAAANIIGRVAGACLGFWLNGRLTFAGDDTLVGRTQFVRFGILWLGTTLVSTWSLGVIDRVVGRGWAWLAKPAVELLLGVAGFIGSRHWVYRR